MARFLLITLLLTLCLSRFHGAGEDPLSTERNWTNDEGNTLTALLLDIGEDSVQLRRSDGQEFSYPIARLSEADQQLIQTLREQERAAREAADRINPQEFNEVLEIPLFSESSLWDESDTAVAARLRLRRESQTSNGGSFRNYTQGRVPVLGANTYSIALLAESDKPVSLSLVFANKGDSPGNYQSQIDADGRTIQERLTNLLGPPRRERVGQERFMRWDSAQTTFLLQVERGEFVALRILPTNLWEEPADQRIPSGQLRRSLEERITRNEQGDVLIRDIPMVDQGPKGYCVPATFERILRYYGIPADMYMLAMIGESTAGGGTSLSVIQRHLEGEVRRQGRRWDTYRSRVTPEEVRRWIDQGTPILWGMRVYPEIDRRATQRSRARRGATDLQSWARDNRPQRLNVQQMIRNQEGGAHICMIIGYNRETNEIAISDSWGPAYEVRWIYDTELEAMCMRNFHIISP